jgi:hypothetical protein
MKKALFALFLCLIFLIGTASAGITVTGSKFLDNATPNIPTIHQMMISTSPTDPITTVFIDVVGFGQAPDQSYIQTNEAIQFITLDKHEIVIPPNGSALVNATILLPSGTLGGKYAMVYIHTNPVGSGSTGFVSAILVPMLITSSAGGVVESATIKSVVQNGSSVITTMENTGNHHYYGIVNSVVFAERTGATGKKSVINSTASPYAIIPGSVVDFTVKIPDGAYLISSSIVDSNGRVLVTKYMIAQDTPIEIPFILLGLFGAFVLIYNRD